MATQEASVKLDAPQEGHLDVAKALFQSLDGQYRLFSLDMRNRQLSIQNAYFWVASAMFTAFGTAFHGLFLGKNFLHLELVESHADIQKALVLIAFAGCSLVIFTGIAAMKGRGAGTRIPFGGSSHPAMYEAIIRMGPDYSQAEAFRWLLEEYNKDVAGNRASLETMGRHLRRTSIMLQVSFLCGLLAFLM